MAQETKQTQVPRLCSTGCGFYGDPRTNGMCSICYKGSLQMTNTSSRVNETVSVPEVSSSLSSLEESLSASSTSVTPAGVTEEVETLGSSEKAETKTQEVTASGSDASTSSATTDSAKSKPKKNRCFICRKKLGLTGFDCRCGNVFCSVHRYTDVHNCAFDYKADGAEKIRKENPVIVCEKVTKI
ncbi:AN1-type zinc finger protein 6 [Tachysurus ichikawai]